MVWRGFIRVSSNVAGHCVAQSDEATPLTRAGRRPDGVPVLAIMAYALPTIEILNRAGATMLRLFSGGPNESDTLLRGDWPVPPRVGDRGPCRGRSGCRVHARLGEFSRIAG